MPPAPRTFDILIVGAGPAGSAAAVTARREGLTVALIDKARFPRDKLCGGLFTGRSAALYRQIFGLEVDPALFEPRQDISFHAHGAQLGPVQRAPTLYLTMRRDMDAHLLDLARAAGAADFTGRRVSRIDITAPGVTLADGTHLTSRIMIGADGVNSIVARALFGRSFDPARIGFALELEAPPTPGAPILQIDFTAMRWGYGWRFPKTRSTTVGVGGLSRENPHMQAGLAAYQRPADGASPTVKGHHLPFGDYRRVPGAGRVLLAGDAAGLVDPVTGEGIAYAMQSGAAAADAAVWALQHQRPGIALAAYRRAVAPIHRSLRMAIWLRPLIMSARTQTMFHSAFARSSVLKAAYLRLLAGELEHSDLFWLVLRRLPGAVLRHMQGR